MIARIMLAVIFGTGLVSGSWAATAVKTEPASSVAAAPVVPAEKDPVKLLKDGNARFASGQLQRPHQDAGRREMTMKEGQKPFASILSCSDSRVPLEHIFDAGTGDLFVVRVAGNVAGPDEIGTLEYGVGHLSTPVLVVLGHTQCGAVTAVVKGDHVGGSIATLAAHIAPVVKKVKGANQGAATADILNMSIRENVWSVMEELLGKSDEIRHLVGAGKLKVIGAIYDIESGKVEWLGEHPSQTLLMGADAVLETLKAGNERAVSGARTYPNQSAERREGVARGGQNPYTTILSCADSRVPLEQVFDAGIGDLFVVRVAGNVAGTSEIGSIEYGAEHLGTPLIVVLGHTKCGAVTAVAKGVHVEGALKGLVAKIVPAVKKAKAGKEEVTDEVIEKAVRENVWQAISDLLKKSEETRHLVLKKKVKVVGALYDIGTGRVEWLGEHPKQKALLGEEAGTAVSASMGHAPAEAAAPASTHGGGH